MDTIANTRFLPLTFTLGSRSHCNVAQYPLHYVISAPAKFEVAASTGLGGDAFTIKYINVAQPHYPPHHMA